MSLLKEKIWIIAGVWLSLTGYSQGNLNAQQFEFEKPFLLKISNKAVNGNFSIRFDDRMDVMRTNLDVNDPTPASYYSYILIISDQKDAKTFNVNSYQVGKKEAIINWNEYVITVLDDSIKRFKLDSSLEGKVLKLQVLKKTE